VRLAPVTQPPPCRSGNGSLIELFLLLAHFWVWSRERSSWRPCSAPPRTCWSPCSTVRASSSYAPRTASRSCLDGSSSFRVRRSQGSTSAPRARRYNDSSIGSLILKYVRLCGNAALRTRALVLLLSLTLSLVKSPTGRGIVRAGAAVSNEWRRHAQEALSREQRALAVGRAAAKQCHVRSGGSVTPIATTE